MDYLQLVRARAPVVASPALVKRRSLHLERVIMRPALPRSARPTPAVAVPVRRAALGAAAVAAIAGMPLAYARTPDPALVAPPAGEMRLVGPMLAALPEPPPMPPLTMRRAPRTSVDDEPVKVDGVRPNPYEEPARARIQRRTPRARGEPHKVSDLKANPYE